MPVRLIRPLSRSSGLYFKPSRIKLWLMPLLQLLMLIFFYTDALYQYWYNWSLLFPAFITG